MRHATPIRRQSGFSMIEVLITLVVLAFGLLGLGLLQTMNLRYTKSADQRTQAVNLTGELLDMMRSNRSELAAYQLAETTLSGSATACGTKATLGATANMDRWKCEVRQSLGPGTKVSVDVSGNPVVVVTMKWNEVNLPGEGEGEVKLRTQL